jgi:phosphatidate cytidylyltransferase
LSRFNLQKLRTRFITAIVVAPISLFAIYAGGWLFWILMGAFFIISQKEWFGLAMKLPQRMAIYPVGILYLCLCFGAFFLIGNDKNVQALLLLVMVISSDVGAYFFGKILGGPKMAKSVSPNKTWAGLAGAMLCPALIMAGYDLAFMVDQHAFQSYYVLIYFIAGAFIGLCSQAGDILVSYMKRKAAVKDTGSILPGHGGVLDRIDSLLLASLAFFVIEYALRYV